MSTPPSLILRFSYYYYYYYIVVVVIIIITILFRFLITKYYFRRDIVIVSSFPQTANGKLDRKALPDPPIVAEPSLEEEEEEPENLGFVSKKNDNKKSNINDNSIIRVADLTDVMYPEKVLRASGGGAKAKRLEDHVIESIYKIRKRRPPPHASFASIGVDSLGAVMFLKLLSDSLGGIRIDPAKIYAPGVTIRSFSRELDGRVRSEKPGLLTTLGIEEIPISGSLCSNEGDPNGKGVNLAMRQIDLSRDAALHQIQMQEDEEEAETEEAGPDGLWAWEQQQETLFEFNLASNRKLLEGLRGVFTFLVLFDHFHTYVFSYRYSYFNFNLSLDVSHLTLTPPRIRKHKHNGIVQSYYGSKLWNICRHVFVRTDQRIHHCHSGN